MVNCSCRTCRGMGAPSLSRRTIAGNTNVWLLDTERGVPRRLTFGVNDNAVILSPDGTRVVHQAKGPRDGSVVYERRSDGTGAETHAARGIRRARIAPPAGLVCRRALHPVRSRQRRRTWICGRCRSLVNGHRSTSRGHRLQNRTRGSRQTAAGSRTNRMRRDSSRFTFSPSRAPDRRCRFPWAAARSRAGGATEASCSTSRPTGA